MNASFSLGQFFLPIISYLERGSELEINCSDL